MDARLAQLRLKISGRVQGVGFRFGAWDEAQSLGLTGWVRNLASGDVELVAEGREDRLKLLAAWAHEGPRAARVTNVREEWAEHTGQFDRFTVR
ncbi:MAG TPA: acylphosphatase [Candidatus Binataceae bacterium]|nr:acylphosphatase [Candidatus Binataceae bacterium]